MRRSPRVAILFGLSLTALLVPYGEVLVAGWRSGRSEAAASGLAFAGAVGIGWARRRALTRPRDGGSPLSLLTLFACTALYVVAAAADFQLGVSLFGVAILASLIAVRGGLECVRALGLPQILLALATPVPGFLQDRATTTLIPLAVRASAPVLDAWIGPVTVSGATLEFSTGAITVVSECSGLSGMTLFIPMSLLMGHYMGPIVRIGWGLLLLLAIPLAFAANLLRIVASGLVVHSQSTLSDSEAFHEFLGLAALAAAMIVLLGAARLFRTRRTNR